MEPDVPEGWHNISALSPVSLLPNETKSLPLTISIPVDALADASYQVGLSAVSRMDPQVSGSARADVRILPNARVKLLGPSEGIKGAPGQVITYSFTVLNLGNGRDRFEITALSAHKEKVDLSAEEIELGVGEKGEVKATIHLPLEASSGTNHVLMFKARSLFLEDSVFAEQIVYTSIEGKKSAERESLYKTLPAELTVYLSGVGTDEPSGMNMDFSTGGQLDDKHWMDFRYRGPYHKDKENASGLSEEVISLDFGGEDWDIGLGDTIASLSELTISSISEEGVRFNLDKAPLEFTFFNMKKEDASFKEDFLGGKIMGKIAESTEIGLNYFQSNEDKLDPTASRSAEDKEMTSISAVHRAGDLLLEGECASGRFDDGSGEKKDKALWVNSALKKDRMSLRAEYIYAGSDYPGRRKDTDGYRVYAGYSLFRPLWLWIYKDEAADNLNNDPSRVTNDVDRVTVGASFSQEKLPSVSLSCDINKSQSKQQQALLSDSKEEAVTFRTHKAFGTLTLSFDSKYSTTTDDIKSVDNRTVEYTGRAYKRWEKISGWIGYSHNVDRDITGDEETLLKKDVSVIYHPSRKLYSSLSFSQEAERGQKGSELLSLDINYDPAPDLSFSMSGEMRNNLADAVREWETWFSVRKSFDIFLPFVKIGGSVEGGIFIDENNNGAADKDEEGIGNIALVIDKNKRSTDKKGRFRFPSIVPGEHELEIDISSIPVGLAPSIKLPYKLDVPKGRLSGISIPLVRVCKVRGRVFEDKNKNVTMDEEEKGLSLVRALLIKDGEINRDTFSDIDGKYGFAGILPGKYHISIDEEWLPYRHRLTTVATYAVELKPGQEIFEMNFGAIEKEKKIIKTYTAPKVEVVYAEKETPQKKQRSYLIFIILMAIFTFLLILYARRKH
ncbi:MAG: hypothetical protein KKD11_04395 [Candidatus Omnitrophica bacterium]|nr:hypothetical protein [Candidatus Omnitrophota bacterium]